MTTEITLCIIYLDLPSDMKKNTITKEQLQARWAYSELRSPRFGDLYIDQFPVLSELQIKSNYGISFSDLSQNEIMILSDAIKKFRPYLQKYIKNVNSFVCKPLSKEKILEAIILPQLDPDAQKTISFSDFLNSPPIVTNSGLPSPFDPRSEAKKCTNGLFFDNIEPIITSMDEGYIIIIDGYFRCIKMMQDSKSIFINAWMPC